MEQSACYNKLERVDSGEGQSTSPPSPDAMVIKNLCIEHIFILSIM